MSTRYHRETTEKVALFSLISFPTRLSLVSLYGNTVFWIEVRKMIIGQLKLTDERRNGRQRSGAGGMVERHSSIGEKRRRMGHEDLPAHSRVRGVTTSRGGGSNWLVGENACKLYISQFIHDVDKTRSQSLSNSFHYLNLIAFHKEHNTATKSDYWIIIFERLSIQFIEFWFYGIFRILILEIDKTISPPPISPP